MATNHIAVNTIPPREGTDMLAEPCPPNAAISADSPDEELVQAMRNGSDRAWTHLLGCYTEQIEAAARTYARTCYSSDAREPLDDIASGLYLCMIERLRESIVCYYRGECRLRTWIFRLIGDRRQIIKAFLMQTDEGRHRADTRLPRTIQRRTELEHEVYKRLVWGRTATRIASDLGLSLVEAYELSEEILETLKEESPRVYGRIMANRQALRPTISLDHPMGNGDGEALSFEAADTGPLPDEVVERRALRRHLPRIRRLIEESLAMLHEDDKRLLMLTFDLGWSLTEVADRAERVGLNAICARHQVDYRITRSMKAVAEYICGNLGMTEADTPVEECREEIIAALKTLFREYGVQAFLQPETESEALALSFEAATVRA